MTSKHWKRDRQARQLAIKSIGLGHIIKVVEIDRGHRNGPEIHKVSDTGIVSIFNKRTGKLITRLIARPMQIKKYFASNEIIPDAVLRLARQHQELGLNHL